MGIVTEDLLVPVPSTQDVRNLVQRAYDAGRARGREEMLALQDLVESPDGVGFDAGEAGDAVKRLRCHLAELKERATLGSDIPGDKQGIEVIKVLLARWQKIAAVVIREAVESHFQTRH
jgi:hypothetical protein